MNISAKNAKNIRDPIPLTKSEGEVRELTDKNFASAIAFSDLPQNLKQKLEEIKMTHNSELFIDDHNNNSLLPPVNLKLPMPPMKSPKDELLIDNQNSLKSSSQNLYETDYLLWLEITLEQVKNRQIDQLDWDNLAEEIEGLKISLHHQVDNYLRSLLIHLLFYQYWTTEREKSGSDWSDKIYDLRDELANLLEYSKTLYNYFVNRIDVIYPRARKSVILKTEFSPATFPEQCPFSVEQILDLNFYPKL